MDARRRFLQREVDEVREGASVTRGGGERRRRRRNMRVGEPRQGCTPTGGGCWCSLDFCPRNEKPRKRERERYTPTDSHPTLFEIDNSGIRICLTNRNDLIRINRGS